MKRIRVLLVVAFLTSLAASAQPTPLSITTTSCPAAVAGDEYSLRLTAIGGTPPYRWRLVDGRLPAGLRLVTGQITGSPRETGEFEFTAAVEDSASPANAVQRKFRIRVNSAMVVSWKQEPQVRDSGIWGSVQVSNFTDKEFDLTVIILAVNEVGKAFALGYQHFNLSAGKVSPAIEFGSSLPYGTYTLNVDAIAEVASINRIYRVHLAAPKKLAIQQP